MKKILLGGLLCLSLAASSCQEQKTIEQLAKEAQKPTDFNDQASYVIGYNMATQFKADSIDMNYDQFIRGFIDGRYTDDSFFTFKERDSIMQTFTANIKQIQEQLRAQKEIELKQKGEVNKVEGPKFLAENKKKEGVKTTESGMQYKVVNAGKGEKVMPSNFVNIHMKMSLADGTVIDSAFVEKPLPIPAYNPQASFKCWNEALPMMHVGDKWMIWSPPELAFGDRSIPPHIAPNSVILFEIEVLQIMTEEELRAQQQAMMPRR